MKYLSRYKILIEDSYGRRVFLASFLTLLVLILSIGELSNTISILRFEEIPFSERLELILFSLFSFDDPFTGVMLLALVLLAAINSALTLLYIQRRKSAQSITGEGLRGGISATFALLAIGCGACGGALIFFMSGLSTTFVSWLIDSKLLALLSIIILAISVHRLSKRFTEDSVCLPDYTNH